MKTNFGNKINIFMALAFIGVWTCKQFENKEKKEEIIVDNIHIEKKPCVSIINDFFGRGADSSKVCDCLIPKFYNLIKNDSLLVEKFKQSDGFFTLEGNLNDSFILLFAQCVKSNILDTNFKFHLTPKYELGFKEKLKKGFKLHKEYENVDVDILSSCIVDKFNGSITISEYLADDYFEVPKIKKIMVDCVKQSAINK